MRRTHLKKKRRLFRRAQISRQPHTTPLTIAPSQRFSPMPRQPAQACSPTRAALSNCFGAGPNGAHLNPRRRRWGKTLGTIVLTFGCAHPNHVHHEAFPCPAWRLLNDDHLACDGDLWRHSWVRTNGAHLAWVAQRASPSRPSGSHQTGSQRRSPLAEHTPIVLTLDDRWRPDRALGRRGDYAGGCRWGT